MQREGLHCFILRTYLENIEEGFTFKQGGEEMKKTYIFNCDECEKSKEEFRVECSNEEDAKDLMSIHYKKRHSTTQSVQDTQEDKDVL